MKYGTVHVGPITAGVAAVLTTIALVAIWVAQHPNTFQALPLVRAVTRFLPARLDAAARRLSDRLGISGVALAVGALGLLIVGALTVGFTALLEDVLDGGGITQFDAFIAEWLAGHREVWLTKVLLVVTRLGNADAQTLWLTAVCLAATARSRSWAPILTGLAGGVGIALVIVVAKRLVGRHRPPSPWAVMPVDGFSFPSGHATGAAAVGLLSAWILSYWVVGRWAVQVAVWATVIATIGLIGFSRCYLGVHYVTDVLAGWLLGAAWAGSVMLLAFWRFSQPARPPSSPASPSP